MKNRFDHVGIAVKNIEASLPFYTQLLGLSVSGRTEIPGRVSIVKLETGGAMMELLQYVDPLSECSVEGRMPGIGHIALWTDDVHADLARLEQAGVKIIDKEPRALADGRLVAFIEGPDKVVIELMEMTEK